MNPLRRFASDVGGGLNREQLTALLCGDDGRGGGKDISFDNREYKVLEN